MAVDIKKSSAAITEKFKQTKSELEAFFDVPPQIYHVGSTAVPGVDGKNILDILISANDSQHMNQIKTRLLAAGYFPSQKPSARPDYLFLASRTEETGEGDIHIHIAIAGTETHDDFLTLRDYLRSRKDEAARYSAAKYTYASQAKFDRSTYKRLKSAYVDEILKRARNWQTQCCDSVKFQSVIEKFTGALSSIRQLENYDTAPYKDYPGKYYFFAITAKDRTYSGEICLLDVGFRLANPMASGSEASPIFAVEDGSGRMAVGCFKLQNSDQNYLKLNERFYYLYQLQP